MGRYDSSDSDSSDDDSDFGFYHHTSLKFAILIAEAKRIRKSKVKYGDASFGSGVYLTTLGEDDDRYVIAKNNYGKNHAKENLYKTKVAIEMELFEDMVDKCDTQRNVYMFDGNIKLKKAKDVTFHVRKGKAQYKSYSRRAFLEKYGD